MSDGITTLLLGATLLGVLAILRGYVGFRPWIRRRLHVPPAAAWAQGEVSADAAGDAPSADQVYFAFAERLLDSQIATSDILDTRATGAISVGSTVLPLAFGLLSLSARTLPPATEAFLGAAVAAYVLLLATAGRALRIRALEYRPDLSTLWGHSQTIDGAALRRWVAEEYAASAETNRPLLIRKARYAGWAEGALLGEGLLISFAAGAGLLL